MDGGDVLRLPPNEALVLNTTVEGPHSVLYRGVAVDQAPGDQPELVGDWVTYDWVHDSTPPLTTIVTAPSVFSSSSSASFNLRCNEPSTFGFGLVFLLFS